MTETFVAELKGQDRIELNISDGVLTWKAYGCLDTLELVQEWRAKECIDEIPVPMGFTHSEMLLREVILKAQKKWNPPFSGVEVCHCRHVHSDILDQVILNGADRISIVSRETGASTACGTCTGDVQKMIDYRNSMSK